jgi:hypothetical protein
MRTRHTKRNNPTIHILASDRDFHHTHHHAMKFAVVVAWLVAASTVSAFTTTVPKPLAFVPCSRTCMTTALAMAKGKENIKKPKKAPATKAAPASDAAPAKAAPAKKKK